MKICKAHLFSWGTCDLVEHKCIKCNKTFYASSCPTQKVCSEYSEKYNICVYCGAKTDTNEADKLCK